MESIPAVVINAANNAKAVKAADVWWFRAADCQNGSSRQTIAYHFQKASTAVGLATGFEHDDAWGSAAYAGQRSLLVGHGKEFEQIVALGAVPIGCTRGQRRILGNKLRKHLGNLAISPNEEDAYRYGLCHGHSGRHRVFRAALPLRFVPTAARGFKRL